MRVIADDEPLARKRLKQLLHLEHDCELVRECSNAQEALSAIKGAAPDLAILDIRMAGRTGLEVTAELRDGRAAVVILVTAYEEYAVRAFDVNAADYLLKPIEPKRFQQPAAGLEIGRSALGKGCRQSGAFSQRRVSRS